MSTKFTLITGLEYVTIAPVRTMTSALLVADYDGRCQLRGFSTSGSTPTFDLEIPTTDYEISQEPSSWAASLKISGLPHEILLFPQISMEDATTPPGGIFVTDIPRDEIDSERLWAELRLQVAASWQYPNMPVCEFHPASLVRHILGSAGGPRPERRCLDHGTTRSASALRST